MKTHEYLSALIVDNFMALVTGFMTWFMITKDNITIFVKVNFLSYSRKDAVVDALRSATGSFEGFDTALYTSLLGEAILKRGGWSTELMGLFLVTKLLTGVYFDKFRLKARRLAIEMKTGADFIEYLEHLGFSTEMLYQRVGRTTIRAIAEAPDLRSAYRTFPGASVDDNYI
jgi:hypothetical protein